MRDGSISVNIYIDIHTYVTTVTTYDIWSTFMYDPADCFGKYEKHFGLRWVGILAALYWEISTKILGAEHGSSRMGGLSRAVVVLGAFHKDILWLQDTTSIIRIAIITVIIIIIFFSFFILILLASAPKSKVADPDHSSWTDVPSEAQRSCSLRSGNVSGNLAKQVWR